MKFRAIGTEDEYKAASAEIEKSMDAKPGMPAGDRLYFLTLLVEAYEAAHHPIGLPDPIKAIKIRMEELNLRRKDLEPILGGKSKVSEVLARPSGRFRSTRSGG